ncbi:hypothetical protein G6F57_000103 [Rhizopus arrhizus]|uniref:Uncharacterized protein n=1 Tax=Rhizopus oryzae TaxID=64495 RepID=A0A9P7BXZ6_RHIOR|nr:hypothetical protein G6F23_000006 [Rhizopus arrhizus]KAG1424772.1 hypothetical protein G6F58_002224 [Rhizopus delemar]KAG0770503.1 hypothetical protein G6F24_000156 [Rhizopus arrhizus]KAG0797989.1 hypothetical protein G6F21_000080 [Rhizopus arrhizus]KAG0802598.1 hypothetical protein G6F22_000101 [Rhizopus arrhizus]
MAPHPIPPKYAAPTEEVQERFKRRLQLPKAMAPRPRARQIQVLTWVLSVSLTSYVVLFADFGQEKHCFTPIRNWFQEKKNKFWTLSEEEKRDLREQGKL